MKSLADHLSNPEGRRALVVALAVLLLIVIDAVLVTAALDVGRVAPAAPRATDPAASPSSGSGSSESPSAAPVSMHPLEQRRLLAVAGDAVLWRAVTSTCAEAQGLVERSSDGGETWEDVTPDGVAEVLDLQARQDGRRAAVVFADGDCETVASRTFIGGADWEADEGAPQSATYATSDGRVVLRGEPLTSDACAAPRAIAAAGNGFVLCDDGLWSQRDGAWSRLELDGVRAISGTDDQLLLALVGANDCPGVLVERRDASQPEPALVADACVEVEDPTLPIAVALGGTEAVVWTGADVVRAPLVPAQ